MKPFYFRLQKVLKYRTFLEKKAQEKLSFSLNAHQEKMCSLKAMVAKRNEYAGICSAEKQSGMEVIRYRWYHSFFQKVNADLESAERVLKKTEADIQSNRELLLQATIRKKTLENLRKMKHIQYVIDCERAEQKELDETTINRKGLSL